MVEFVDEVVARGANQGLLDGAEQDTVQLLYIVLLEMLG